MAVERLGRKIQPNSHNFYYFYYFYLLLGGRGSAGWGVASEIDTDERLHTYSINYVHTDTHT